MCIMKIMIDPERMPEIRPETGEVLGQDTPEQIAAREKAVRDWTPNPALLGGQAKEITHSSGIAGSLQITSQQQASDDQTDGKDA